IGIEGRVGYVGNEGGIGIFD
ncbi:MAG: hypothetical protein EZS28_037941, partial [Streblomastix strix]